jgi:pre-mRNA-splicing factor SPF27
LENAEAQLEHQRTRTANLELMNKFGSNHWRVTNFLVEKDLERIQREDEDVRKRTEDVNRSRKSAQVSVCPSRVSGMG